MVGAKLVQQRDGFGLKFSGSSELNRSERGFKKGVQDRLGASIWMPEIFWSVPASMKGCRTEVSLASLRIYFLNLFGRNGVALTNGWMPSIWSASRRALAGPSVKP